MKLRGGFSLVVDGCINVDEPCAREIGFTADKWTEDSYLWRTGDEIKCSLLTAKEPGKGAFKALVAAIRAKGLRVAVPTPLATMTDILKHWNWRWDVEMTPLGWPCEVWRPR